MSQAPVGQRSAHNPQCRQTSSSLTITLPVFSSPDTYRSCVGFLAGALRRPRRSASSPFCVKLMQSIGQMSTQASHSMHSLSANTVCTSQFRQRWASLKPVAGSKPSSTSTLRSEEHTSELQSLAYLVCRLLLEKKKKKKIHRMLQLASMTECDNTTLVP